MSNFSENKKEALHIASRFLKEVGLYDLWIRYLYDPRTAKSWIDKPNHKFKDSDILRNTQFTNFVYKHKRDSKIGTSFLMCELLEYYLAALKTPSGVCGPITIDKEKKKIVLHTY